MSVPQQYVSQFLAFQQAEQSYIENNTPPGMPVPTFDEGGPADLLTGAHATVADMLGQDIWQAQQQAYIMTASGTALSNKGADRGIYQKQPVAASGTFTFTTNVSATQTITIAQGALITTIATPTNAAVTFSTTQTATLSVGATSVQVPATCTQPGSLGNLGAGTQLLIGSSLPGIDGVSLGTSITTGVDEETTSAYRQRILNAFQGLALGTSGWYVGVATGVIGVASATTQTNYQGSPQAVAVYVAGPNNTVPPATTVQAVQTALNAAKPMIDVPYAIAATPLTINVTGTVTVPAGSNDAAIQQNVETAITNFLNAIPQGGLGAVSVNGATYPMTGTLYISQLGAQASAQTNVLDYNSFTINGSTSALALTVNQLPQAGIVTITVVEA